MITEDYISFETAKLLKEKGFNELTPLSYSLPYGYESHIPCSNGVDTDFVSRITLQMAMKWLRKRHNLHIEIRITNHSISSMVNVIKYYWVMCDTETGRWCDESTVYTVKAFDTPEEAEEDAIKHALENLTQKDSNPSI